MTDLKSEFITWYFNEFHNHTLWQRMFAVSEDSPWHREETIGIHTDMVVTQYVARTPGSDADTVWSIEELCGAFAAAFHDVGKPNVVQFKFKPERGNYKSFGGHELVSARLWEDYAVLNWERLQQFGLTPFDIYRIGWLIEHHLPWGVTKPEKRLSMATTVVRLELVDAFINLLLADTWGRISDDGPEKKAKVDAWIHEFAELTWTVPLASETDDNTKTLLVPIATSGSGKTTYRNTKPEYDVFCLDDLRLLFYADPSAPYTDETYNCAYKMSCDDPKFKSRAHEWYHGLLKAGRDIFLDNMNVSRKRRRFFINEARQRGYKVVAVLFPVAIETVLERQGSRTDKTVPTEAVRRAYMGLQLPSYGEFDEIVVNSGNLPAL